jgi:hypothetical protein
MEFSQIPDTLFLLDISVENSQLAGAMPVPKGCPLSERPGSLTRLCLIPVQPPDSLKPRIDCRGGIRYVGFVP